MRKSRSRNSHRLFRLFLFVENFHSRDYPVELLLVEGRANCDMEALVLYSHSSLFVYDDFAIMQKNQNDTLANTWAIAGALYCDKIGYFEEKEEIFSYRGLKWGSDGDII